MKLTKDENKRATQIIQNYNRRVNRLSKTINTRKLPDTVTIRQLKSLHSNRADFNKHLKLLESFNKESMNDFIRLNDTAKVNKFKYLTSQMKSKKALRELDKAIRTSYDIDNAEGRGFESERTRNLINSYRTIKKGMSRKADYSEYLRALKSSDRWVEKRYETNETFYKNFISMLWEGSAYGDVDLDPQLLEDIENQIKQLTPEQLYEMYNREELLKNIVEDYHRYLDTDGGDITSNDRQRSLTKLELLRDALPALIQKYHYTNKENNPRVGKNMDLSAPQSSTWEWSDKPLNRKPLKQTQLDKLRGHRKGW